MSIAYKVYVDIVAQKFWFWENLGEVHTGFE